MGGLSSGSVPPEDGATSGDEPGGGRRRVSDITAEPGDAVANRLESLKTPASIVLIAVTVVALICASLVGGELYMRHWARSQLTAMAECLMAVPPGNAAGAQANSPRSLTASKKLS
jgi:hypothetical protein